MSVPRDAFFLLPWLAGLIVGLLAFNSLFVAVAVMVALLIGYLAILLKISLVELVVLTSPIMFFPPIDTLIHIAVSDFFIALLFGGLLGRGTEVFGGVGPRPSGSGGVFLLAIAGSVAVSVSVAVLADSQFRWSFALLDGMKLTVVLGYLVIVYKAMVAGGYPTIVKAMNLWVWVAAVMAAGSLLGLMPSDGQRSLGFFQDPNLYAGYLLVSLVLVFVRASEGGRGAWILAPLLLGGIITTASRGAIVTLLVLVAMAALLMVGSRIWNYAATLGMLGATCLLLLTPSWSFSLPGVERLLSASGDIEHDPRFNLWRRALELWSENPLTGVGLGQYPRFSAGLTPFKGGDVGQVAHNSFLSVAAELGTVGLVAFLVGLASMAVKVGRARHLGRWTKRSLLIGFAVIAVQMMSLNLQNLRYVWIYFGLALAMAAAPRNGHDAVLLDRQSDSATRARH